MQRLTLHHLHTLSILVLLHDCLEHRVVTGQQNLGHGIRMPAAPNTIGGLR
ncbi:unnamed protein product [Ectocarpus sp. 6 AP-2014]